MNGLCLTDWRRGGGRGARLMRPWRSCLCSTPCNDWLELFFSLVVSMLWRKILSGCFCCRNQLCVRERVSQCDCVNYSNWQGTAIEVIVDTRRLLCFAVCVRPVAWMNFTQHQLLVWWTVELMTMTTRSVLCFWCCAIGCLGDESMMAGNKRIETLDWSLPPQRDRNDFTIGVSSWLRNHESTAESVRQITQEYIVITRRIRIGRLRSVQWSFY